MLFVLHNRTMAGKNSFVELQVLFEARTQRDLIASVKRIAREHNLKGMLEVETEKKTIMLTAEILEEGIKIKRWNELYEGRVI